jgi:hypothetical protein
MDAELKIHPNLLIYLMLELNSTNNNFSQLYTFNLYYMKFLHRLPVYIILVIFISMSCDNQPKYPLTEHPNSGSWQELFTDDLSNAIYPDGVWSYENGQQVRRAGNAAPFSDVNLPLNP